MLEKGEKGDVNIESRELSQLDEQKKNLKNTENEFVRIRAENIPNDKKVRVEDRGGGMGG